LYNHFYFIIIPNAELRKQPRCPTTDEWIKKMYLYTMEFYSATKKEILLLVGKWMELENIRLSKVNQVQQTKSHVFSLIHNIDLTQIQQYYEKQVKLRGGHI
jgi:hypothetical protein